MPVPNSIDDLEPVPADNYPAGSEPVFPNLDNYLRAHAAFIAQLRDSQGEADTKIETAEEDIEALQGAVLNTVKQTDATGAVLLPEGSDAQRPATGSIPAGALVMRGSTQTVGDYIAEYWDRGASAWRGLASRTWVTAAITTLQNNWLGYAIVYPNGGTAAAPANVAVSSRYEVVNPFPGKHVLCQAELLVGGKWSVTGWVYTGSAQGVMAALFDDKIVVKTAQYLAAEGVYSGCPNPAVLGSISSPTPCRVKVWVAGGATA